MAEIAYQDMVYVDGRFTEEAEWKEIGLPCAGSVEELISYGPRKLAARMDTGQYCISDDFGETWTGPWDQLELRQMGWLK